MAKENVQSLFKRLQNIVNELSTKEVDVEAGLEKFKEGVALIKACRAQLQKAENEFKRVRAELEIGKGDDKE